MEIKARVQQLYNSVGGKIEKGSFRDAIQEIFEAVRFGNVYYDAKQPWKSRVEDPEKCRNTIGNCSYLIANIANLLNPFLPFSSAKVADWLGITLQWKEQEVVARNLPPNLPLLFSKIDSCPRVYTRI